MFDAKSLLEALMRGAQQAPTQGQGGAGGLGDLLGQLAGGAGGQGGAAGQAGPGSLGDLLGKMMQGSGPAATSGQGGGLGDLLGRLQQMAPGGQDAQPGGQGQSGGSIIDVLGQVLGQATQGVREGAGAANQATGAGDKLRDMLQQSTGKSPEELLAQLQELIKNNQLGAGAALGGLGALVLGTRSGRSLATGAVKLGALALIGGLAYRAYQNHMQGKPPLTGGQALVNEAAPAGSGFEPQAISNEAAILYIRAMIAAAAADGRIDAGEQKKIMGGLEQAGLQQEARAFLEQEIQAPASAEDLAAGVSSQEEAVQVFTAARLAVDLDNQAESKFLVELANALGLDASLVNSIDQAARAAD